MLYMYYVYIVYPLEIMPEDLYNINKFLCHLRQYILQHEMKSLF